MENDRLTKAHSRDRKKNSKHASEDFQIVEQPGTKSRTSSESPLSQRKRNKDEERKRTKPKRPEVQVYVPRGRRTQDIPTTKPCQPTLSDSIEASPENIYTSEPVTSLYNANDSEDPKVHASQPGRSRKPRPSAQVYVPRQRRQQAQEASQENDVSNDMPGGNPTFEETKWECSLPTQGKSPISEVVTGNSERTPTEISNCVSVSNDKVDLSACEVKTPKTAKNKKHKHGSKSDEEKGKRKRKINDKQRPEHLGESEVSLNDMRQSPMAECLDDNGTEVNDQNPEKVVPMGNLNCKDPVINETMDKYENNIKAEMQAKPNNTKGDFDQIGNFIGQQSGVDLKESLREANSSDSVYSDAQQSIQEDTDGVQIEETDAIRQDEKPDISLTNIEESGRDTNFADSGRDLEKEGESSPIDPPDNTLVFRQSISCVLEQGVSEDVTSSAMKSNIDVDTQDESCTHNIGVDITENSLISNECCESDKLDEGAGMNQNCGNSPSLEDGEILDTLEHTDIENVCETNGIPEELSNLNNVDSSEKVNLIGEENSGQLLSHKDGKSESSNVSEVVNEDEEEDEDSWDKMFDDDGECLDPKLMEELTIAVGKVKVQKPQFDYLSFQPKDPEIDQELYGHLIEIHDFPKEFETRDLISAFQSFMSRGFDIKWVDDTHAIGVFASAVAAQDALCMVHPLFKTRPISQATRQTKVKAKRCTEFLQPYKPRPETTAAAARRLVAGALGITTNVPREKRELERRQLKEAKERKRQQTKLKRDAWDGTIGGRCAMDIEDD